GGHYLNNSYESVDLSGNNKRVHFTSKYANNFVPSPNNKWVAFNHLFKVYIAPMPRAGTGVKLGAHNKAILFVQVAEYAGINLHRSNNGQKLHWTLGEEYFTVGLNDAFDFLEGESDKELPLATKSGINIGLELDFDEP